MLKQLLLIVTGDFNLIEYKNLAQDRTSWFNLQSKALETPEIRCKTRAEAEDRIAILLEGEESEVRELGEVIKRGPLTAHIVSREETWRDPKPSQPRPAAAPGEGQKRRRRRRRR